MFTIEEYLIVSIAIFIAITALCLIFYEIYLLICAHIDARAELDALTEADISARRLDIGNDIHPLSHHGRG